MGDQSNQNRSSSLETASTCSARSICSVHAASIKSKGSWFASNCSICSVSLRSTSGIVDVFSRGQRRGGPCKWSLRFTNWALERWRGMSNCSSWWIWKWRLWWFGREKVFVHSLLYAGPFFQVFFSEMTIESGWRKIFDTEVAIYSSKWWVVFKNTLYVTVNQ